MRKKLSLEEKIQQELKEVEASNARIKKIIEKKNQMKSQTNTNLEEFDLKNEELYLGRECNEAERELGLSIETFTDASLKIDAIKLLSEKLTIDSESQQIKQQFIQNNKALIPNSISNRPSSRIKSTRQPININSSKVNVWNNFLLIKDFYMVTKKKLSDLVLDTLSNSGQQSIQPTKSNLSKLQKDIILLLQEDIYNALNITQIDIEILKIYQDTDESIGMTPQFVINEVQALASFQKQTERYTQSLMAECAFLSFMIDPEEFEKTRSQFVSACDLAYLKYKAEYEASLNSIIEKLYRYTNHKKSYTLSNSKRFLQNIIYLYAYTDFVSKGNSFNNQLSIQLKKRFQFHDKDLVEAYVNWVTSISKFPSQRKTLIKAYEDELIELKEVTIKLIEDSYCNYKENLIRTFEDKESEIRRKEMNELREKNLESYSLKLEQVKSQLDKEAKEKEAQEEKERIKKEIYLNQIKHQSNNFKEQKLTGRKMRDEEYEQEIRAKEEQIQREIKEKLPIIKMRQEEANKAFICNLKSKERNEQDAIDIKQRLENIVMNLKIRPDVKSDPQRLVQETESLRIKIKNKENNISDINERASVFKDPNSYTTKEMLGDYRFRVQTYMAERGLNPSVSAAANELINKLFKK